MNLLKKRKNLSKDEIKVQAEQTKKNEQTKELVRNIFPLLSDVESIYDAQTTVMALSGFINAHVEVKTHEIKMSDLTIDLSAEKESAIKTAIIEIMEVVKDEPAKNTAQVLERLGKALADYGTNKFMKQPMDTIAITDILA